MSLGLSHSLSRYKLKFSPDKVNMINISWDKASKSVCSPQMSDSDDATVCSNPHMLNLVNTVACVCPNLVSSLLTALAQLAV